MKHIFKVVSTGGYKTKAGESYECKCVDSSEKLPAGWCHTLEKALKVQKKAPAKVIGSVQTEL